MDRRTVILDAALEVLAREGARALTHRAVDAAAGIPADSMLGGLGANDPAASAEEVAATMDGVLLSVLLRGSDDVAATTAMLYRAADHVVRAQPGVR